MLKIINLLEIAPELANINLINLIKIDQFKSKFHKNSIFIFLINLINYDDLTQF